MWLKTPNFTCLKFTRVYIMSSIDIKTKMTQTRIALLVICHIAIARAIGQEQQTHAKWWQRYDVLVVGAGLSGAAGTALLRGAAGTVFIGEFI